MTFTQKSVIGLSPVLDYFLAHKRQGLLWDHVFWIREHLSWVIGHHLIRIIANALL